MIVATTGAAGDPEQRYPAAEYAALRERESRAGLAELKLPAIVKRDERREPFSEPKLRGGLERACEKRPVSLEEIDHVIDVVVKKLRTSGEREVSAKQLGDWVMMEMKNLDQVAYVRFASVYRRFEDVQAFREEIERLEKDLPVELRNRQLPLLEEPEE